MKFRLVFVSLLSIFIGCSTKTTANISISLMDSLKFGQTKQEDIRKLLGIPDRIVPLADNNDVLWVYKNHDKSRQRANFEFSKEEVLLSAVLVINDQDPERKLDNAKRHFPLSNFTREEAKWAKGADYAPDEVSFQDSEHGITIGTRKSTGNVIVIGWSQPAPKHIDPGPKPASKSPG